MPPQANARLTAVNEADAGTGGLDDWDAPAAPGGAPAGAVKWSGDEAAYYRERVERRTAGDGSVDVVEVRVLYVDTEVARAAGIDTDDVITFTDPTGASRTARAALVARAELDGIPTTLQTTRLELEVR